MNYLETFNISDLISENNGLIYAYIYDLENFRILDKILSPFFTAIFWDEIVKLELRIENKYFLNVAEFLIDTQDRLGGWKFFPGQKRYPVDLDDTAIIGDFLYKNKLLNPGPLIKLIENNRKDKYNFYVWTINNGKRYSNNIDPIVNLNIYNFLHSVNYSYNGLPSYLVSWLKDIKNIPSSEYYKDPTVRLWFFIRSCFFQSNQVNYFQLNSLMNSFNDLSSSVIIINYIKSILGIKHDFDFFNHKNNTVWFKHRSKNIGYTCPSLDYLIIEMLDINKKYNE